MKKTILLTILAAMTIVVASCTTTKTSVDAKPQRTCVVTGNTLGSMGDPVSVMHNGKTVKLCCRPCIKKFKADPEKYLEKHH
jgi:hypothetical protein